MVLVLWSPSAHRCALNLSFIVTIFWGDRILRRLTAAKILAALNASAADLVVYTVNDLEVNYACWYSGVLSLLLSCFVLFNFHRYNLKMLPWARVKGG